MEGRREDGTRLTTSEDPLGKKHPKKRCPSPEEDSRRSSDTAEETASGVRGPGTIDDRDNTTPNR